MNKEGIYIGSHVSMSGPDFFLASVKEALSYNATTFMFYTGAPQNTFRTPLDKCKIEEGLKAIKEAGLSLDKIVVHAPYIINLANKAKPETFDIAIKALKSELIRTEAFGAKLLVLHPGSHVGQGVEVGLNNILEGLEEVLKEDKTNVTICLETMAGKGTECGATFDEINYLLTHSKYKDRLAVCLDTCHVNDEGVDIKDIDGVLKLFDEKIGLKHLKVLHINDSKNPIGAHKDRHENIGYGYIGFETLYKYIHHPLLRDIPKILETPYYNDKPPYKEEIEMLLSGVYKDNWRDNL